jgi:hypothetical protein
MARLLRIIKFESFVERSEVKPSGITGIISPEFSCRDRKQTLVVMADIRTGNIAGASNFQVSGLDAETDWGGGV